MKVIEEQQNKWKSVNIYIIIITFLYNFFGEKQYMELFPLALIINIRIFFSCLPEIQKKRGRIYPSKKWNKQIETK